jgi:sn-glycerol 3-phosphate transport system permease protein
MLATLSVFSFLMAWNQYLWPLLVADDRQYRTIQIALQSLVKSNPDQLNQGYAAVIMAFIPLFLLLIFFERQLVRGLTAGAVKG